MEFNNNNREIERRFLPNKTVLFKISPDRILFVSQLYFFTFLSKFNISLRYRWCFDLDYSGEQISEDYYTFTFKSGKGMNRYEKEWHFDNWFGEIIYNIIAAFNAPLIKERYIYNIGIRTFEYDKFAQANLDLLEVEFPTEDSAEKFNIKAYQDYFLEPVEFVEVTNILTSKKVYDMICNGKKPTTEGLFIAYSK